MKINLLNLLVLNKNERLLSFDDNLSNAYISTYPNYENGYEILKKISLYSNKEEIIFKSNLFDNIVILRVIDVDSMLLLDYENIFLFKYNVFHKLYKYSTPILNTDFFYFHEIDSFVFIEDGYLKIYNLNIRKITYEIEMQENISNIIFKNNLLILTTNIAGNGYLYFLDINKKKVLEKYKYDYLIDMKTVNSKNELFFISFPEEESNGYKSLISFNLERKSFNKLAYYYDNASNIYFLSEDLIVLFCIEYNKLEFDTSNYNLKFIFYNQMTKKSKENLVSKYELDGKDVIFPKKPFLKIFAVNNIEDNTISVYGIS